MAVVGCQFIGRCAGALPLIALLLHLCWYWRAAVIHSRSLPSGVSRRPLPNFSDPHFASLHTFIRHSQICLDVVACQTIEGDEMRNLIAVLLCVTIPIMAFAGDNSYKVTYDGGSLPDIKSGTGVKLYIESNQVRLVKDNADITTIQASSITEISYGQDVHRRVGAAIGLAVVSLGIGALMALTKSKKHYVGLTWAEGDKKGGFAMQCDKSDYRGVLAGLEGISGKKAVDSDAMTVKN